MRNENFIATKDLNEVARIHSDLKYINWRMEFVDGEYRFYSPTYKKNDTLVFYHGGAEPDFTIEKLDVLKSSEKQQNSSNNYAGFYMYSEKDKDSAYHYAEQENTRKQTNSKGVMKVFVDSNLKIYEVPPFSITRITKDQIEALQQQGYDMIAGTMLGKTEYVLINKSKIQSMEFESLSKVQNVSEQDTIVSLEQLESILKEEGYLCLGHGTGRRGNSEEIVDSIFKQGIRTKDGSLYYTTIGLDIPSTEVLKEKLNNWQHQDSKKVILARIPTEYINMLGESGDLDGERFGAFTVERVDDTGKAISYLDPKFIIGCYDVEKQMVRLNRSFERTLSETTIQQLRQNYIKAVEKTKARLKRMDEALNPVVQQEQVAVSTQQDIGTFDWDSFDFPEIEWDIPSDQQHIGKSR